MEDFYRDMITAINESQDTTPTVDYNCPISQCCNQIIFYVNANEVTKDVYSKVNSILSDALLMLTHKNDPEI